MYERCPITRSVELRTEETRLTWRGSGPELVFRLTGPDGDVVVRAGPELLRQMKQMIAWAEPRG